MKTPSRYAVYFVPAADSLLYRFGSSMLGYDCYTGADVAPPHDAGLPGDWQDLTEAPRRYGFHATLKAPFGLAVGLEEAALLEAFADFARQTRAVPIVQPTIRTLGDFIAIVPSNRSTLLDTLAADCVRHFDRFRAELSQDELERRLTPALSKRERANVNRWGYPYVFEDFCFHMTLTGRLAGKRRDALCRLLSSAFIRAHGGDRIKVDRIALLRQDHAGAPFRILKQAILACEA